MQTKHFQRFDYNRSFRIHHQARVGDWVQDCQMSTVKKSNQFNSSSIPHKVMSEHTYG